MDGHNCSGKDCSICALMSRYSDEEIEEHTAGTNYYFAAPGPDIPKETPKELEDTVKRLSQTLLTRDQTALVGYLEPHFPGISMSWLKKLDCEEEFIEHLLDVVDCRINSLKYENKGKFLKEPYRIPDITAMLTALSAMEIDVSGQCARFYQLIGESYLE